MYTQRCKKREKRGKINRGAYRDAKTHPEEFEPKTPIRESPFVGLRSGRLSPNANSYLKHFKIFPSYKRHSILIPERTEGDACFFKSKPAHKRLGVKMLNPDKKKRFFSIYCGLWILPNDFFFVSTYSIWRLLINKISFCNKGNNNKRTSLR